MRNKIDNVNCLKKPSDIDALELMHTVMHQFRSRQFSSLREQGQEVTRMDSRVLGFFGRHPGATLSDLADHSGRDKAQLTRLIKGLRERGLLDATPDPDDRRNVRLQLSAAGAGMQEALQAQGKQLGTRAFKGVTAAQRQQLCELLQKISANLADQ